MRTIAYDSVGMIAGYTLGDPNGSGNKAGSFRSLVRDSAGRIVGYVHTNSGASQPSLDQTFAYDNLDRLTGQTTSATSYAYTYDATGNRTSKSVGGTTYTNIVDPNSNKLTQTQDINGTANVQYDAAGHTTSDGINTYSYSDRGRMANASAQSGSITFKYDGLELRTYKASSSGTSYYVYDEAGQLLGEYDYNSNPIYETIYLSSTPVGVVKQNAIYNMSADHVATPRLLTKQDQTIVWRWDGAEVFGADAPNQDPSALGLFIYNQRFPGQVFDIESGLNQNWNRDYDPKFGRYRQSDPIGL